MGLSDLVERWAFQGNESADRMLQQPDNFLPPRVFWAWQQFDRDFQIRQKACQELHSMFVQFGLRCVEAKVDQAERDEQKWDDMQTPKEVNEQDISLVASTIARRTPQPEPTSLTSPTSPMSPTSLTPLTSRP